MTQEKESRTGCVDWAFLFTLIVFVVLPTISWWWGAAQAIWHWVKR